MTDSPGTASPRNRGKDLLPLFAVGLAVAFSLFGDTAMYVVLPVHQVALGLSAMQVGVLLSINRWIRLITNRVAERMLRRFGSRAIFPAALLLGAAIAAAYATAPIFWILLLLRAVWGVCWSFIRQTGVMTTISLSRRSRAGRSMGIYVGLLQVGFVAGTFLAGVIFDASGYRATFLLAAALSLAAMPPALLAGRKRPTAEAVRTVEHVRPGGAAVRLQIRGFIVSLVGTGMVMSTLGFLLRSRYGDSVPIASLAVGVTTVNGALLASQYLIKGVGSPLFGAAIDRHGLARSQFVAFATAGAALLAAGLFSASVLLIPFVVLFFIASAIGQLAVDSDAAIAGPRAYAGLATATDLGAAVGPVLGWTGIQIARSDSVFWVGGVLFFIGALLTISWRRPAVHP